MMLAYPQTKELLIWGLVDKHSQLQGFLPRTDCVEKRPVLFDLNYKPRLTREAVAAAPKAAPVRE